MNTETTDATMDDLRLAIISKIRTAQDIQSLASLEPELFGMSSEPLNALYRVTVMNVQAGVKPPSTSAIAGIHMDFVKKSLAELVVLLREEDIEAKIRAAYYEAVESEDASLDFLINRLAEIKAGSQDATGWLPVSLEDVKAMEFPEQRWLWEGYLGAGEISLLSASPKEGKSTLVFHLLPALLAGEPFFERPTTAAKVLIVTEESARQVQDKLGAASYENAVGIFNPFGMSWEALMAHVSNAVQTDGVTLVIIDTLAAFWQVGDENNQADIGRALRPIFSISRTYGTAFLLLHHDRKEAGGGIASVRGSSALPAAVDAVIKLKRDTGKDTRRILSVIGRSSETASPLLVDLDADTKVYKAIGTPTLVERAQAKIRILDVLPDGPPGWPAKQIAEHVQAGTSGVYAALEELRRNNIIGFARNGNAFVYWNPNRMTSIDDDGAAAAEEADALVKGL